MRHMTIGCPVRKAVTKQYQNNSKASHISVSLNTGLFRIRALMWHMTIGNPVREEVTKQCPNVAHDNGLPG